MKLYEASLGGSLEVDAVPCNLQYNGNFEQGSFHPNEENGGYSICGINEGWLHRPYFVTTPEGYIRPVHAQSVFLPSPYLPYYPITNENCVQDDKQVQQVPFGTLSEHFPSEFNTQEFQYFVVIDFEATCDKEKNPHPQEIIEFPSVLVNSYTGELEDQFQVYVRPTHNKKLSDFCKELTGIKQTQVDKGVPLSVALDMHDNWLERKGVKKTNFVVVTWSNWDCRVMLESECRFKQIKKPSYFNRWINLRVPFNEVFGGIRCNLKEAVQAAGLLWEGRAHCGLDDAKNTARLLTNLMYRGIQFTITNSLMLQPSELPLKMQQLAVTEQQPWFNPYIQLVPFFQSHQLQVSPEKDQKQQQVDNYCFCGVKCRKIMVQTPGDLNRGYFYLSCGNWTASGEVMCPYAQWATL